LKNAQKKVREIFMTVFIKKKMKRKFQPNNCIPKIYQLISTIPTILDFLDYENEFGSFFQLKTDDLQNLLNCSVYLEKCIIPRICFWVSSLDSKSIESYVRYIKKN
jgi:hypothetical protein